MTANRTGPYVGRFAPSPTGPLHFGSLVAALASFLDARAHGGRWIVRMEDLDPPREMPGASDSILTSLQAHGLQWDGEILYQSQRGEVYRRALETLDSAGLLYSCGCSRRDIAAQGGIYPGTCRARLALGPALEQLAGSDRAMALRVKTGDLPSDLAKLEKPIAFDDLIFGPQTQDVTGEVGDFVVLRKDGYYAYQLAVVVDDIAQGITHVIRGGDLLACTAQQMHLFGLLRASPPVYGHIPLAVDRSGQKLSKQQGAPALDNNMASKNLLRALRFLGQAPTAMESASCEEILQAAVENWDRNRIPRTAGRKVH